MKSDELIPIATLARYLGLPPGLVKLEQSLKGMVEAGEHKAALTLIDDERSIYPNGAAHTAFGELEKKVQRQIHRRLRGVPSWNCQRSRATG